MFKMVSLCKCQYLLTSYGCLLPNGNEWKHFSIFVKVTLILNPLAKLNNLQSHYLISNSNKKAKIFFDLDKNSFNKDMWLMSY